MGYDSSLNGNVSIGNDLTIVGRLNVRQYSSQNIINTTTTNYQLIVSEDLSLNGRMYVSGNVGIGITNPRVALDVSGVIYTNNITKTTTVNQNFNSDTQTWFLLGRYDSTASPGNGSSFILEIVGGGGYNNASPIATDSGYFSGGKTTIYGRILNNFDANKINLNLSYKFEGSSLAPITNVIGVQVGTNRNQYDIYVQCNSYSQCALNVDTVTLGCLFSVNPTISNAVTAPSTIASSTVAIGKLLISINNGAVGIGITNPAVALDVNGVCKSQGGFVSASGFKSLTQSAQVIHTFRGGHAILTISTVSNYYGIFYVFWTPNLSSPFLISLGASNLACSIDSGNLNISAWVGGSLSRNAVWNIMYLQVPDYQGNNSVT